MRRFLFFLLLILVGAGIWIFVLKPKQVTQEGSSASGGTFQSFLSAFRGEVTQQPGESDQTVTPQPEETVPELDTSSPFKQISVGPVAGATVFSITKTVTVPAADPKLKPTTQTVTEHFVRYVARSSGYVYEIKDGGTPTQISNVYIPNVYEASFADGNKTALIRFLRDDNRTVATHAIPIPEPNPDGTRTQQGGIYFPDNISALAVSPDGKTVARVTNEGENAVIATTDTKNGLRKELLRNPFGQWLLLWPNQTIYLQTKATGFADGFLYRIDTVNKRLLKVLGGIKGLTVSLSPKGTYLLYSESLSNSFTTKLLATKTNTLKNLNLSILPEKCVWLANEDLICAGNDYTLPAMYPDSWYAGTVSFTDKLYRVYSSLGTYDIIEGGNEFSYDATALLVNESMGMLYFIDKASGLLWQFDY